MLISKDSRMLPIQKHNVYQLVTAEGKDFAEMAKKHSDGPSDLREVILVNLSLKLWLPFSEAAFALAVGAISEVVETDFGYIIKRTE